MKTRTSRHRAFLVLTVAFVAAACGGDEERAAPPTPPRPTLDRAVADDLAARSDAIAEALDAGDVCTAAVRADELLDATVRAINEGRVPREFQEDLQAHANELVNTVNCPPPPEEEPEEEDEAQDEVEGEGEGDGEGNRKGKGKGKGKDKSEGDGDEGGIVTIPPPEEVVP